METLRQTEQRILKAPRRCTNFRCLAGSVGLAFVLVSFIGCTSDTAKKHYLAGEKFWAEKRYQDAADEFEVTHRKNPTGKLALKSLYRAAMTQALFLSDYPRALENFRTFIDAASPSSPTVWTAKKQVADILFDKQRKYSEAAQYIKTLIEERPDAPEVPEFKFQIAKAYFYLWKFEDAIAMYQRIQQDYPGSVWAERASFQTGVTLFTAGEEKQLVKDPYKKAMEAYKQFIQKYPQSMWAVQARFGIAACLEELDQLDAASKAYSEIVESYPSPHVIRIKMARIAQRLVQRRGPSSH